MYNDDDISGGFNNLGGPYQFLNQAAVTNAMASGQNIDWAQLAQQWIQMRDSTTTAIGVTDFSASDSAGNVSAHGSSRYEEKGEADMDMDDEEHMDERNSSDRNKRNSLFSVMQHQPSSANSPWFTDKTNVSNTESRTDITSQKANQWSSSQTMLQIACDPRVANRQANSTAHIPSLLSMHVPNPNALPDNSNEQNGQQTMMDAAKRKALPAWIREGLEKMEREKQKQQEQHLKEELSGDSDVDSPVHFKVATDDEEDDDTIEAPMFEPTTETDANCESEVFYKSYEQKLSELMVVVRRTLTELLLEVTNEEISKVATEAVKSYKMKASSAQVIHKSALSSITSKLGLAAYDDSSSDEYSDDDVDENSPVRKGLPSDCGNDSEEDIKNTVRSKRRAFAKIANEIEERVAAAASKEEEKLKHISSKEEATAGAQKHKPMERKTGAYQVEADANDTHVTQTSAGCSGKLFERDTGETTESMLQTLNGKLQKERGARKERTTRFSDNRDNKYLAIAASASYIRDMQSIDPISTTTTISSQSLTNVGQIAYKTTALPSSTSTIVEAVAEMNPKHKTTLSPEKIVDRDRDKKQTYLKNSQRRRTSRDSTPASQSSSSSSSSSSSTSSDLDSSTSNSSDNSRYSNKSHRKHSSYASQTDKSKTSRQSQWDKRDDRKYNSSHADKDRDSYHSRYRNDRSRSRSRSRSHYGRRRHGSHDSDKDYSRRKHDSRYSSSQSRSRNSSHRYHDYSTSNSRSSYSSSSNRRH